MLEQLSLFDIPKAGPDRYRLFLGIFPDAKATHLICDHQINLGKQSGLRGKPRPRNNLHVTLHHIGDYPEIPERVVASVIKACASVLANRPSVEVIFDHAMTFRGNHAFVLVNPNGNEALRALHRPLITELIKHRLAKPKDFQFEPHVTMLYDEHLVPEGEVPPVIWIVKEVVLILSHLGATKYERLGSWDLNVPS